MNATLRQERCCQYLSRSFKGFGMGDCPGIVFLGAATGQGGLLVYDLQWLPPVSVRRRRIDPVLEEQPHNVWLWRGQHQAIEPGQFLLLKILGQISGRISARCQHSGHPCHVTLYDGAVKRCPGKRLGPVVRIGTVTREE